MLDSALSFGLACYFAVTLSVSGLAKIEQPEYFAAILRWHRLLPAWSVGGVSRLIPWVEIAIAGALTTGILPRITTAVLFGLYSSFLMIHVFLLMSRHTVECGCHGNADEQVVDGASTITALITTVLAGLSLWLALRTPSVPWPCHLAASVLLGSGLLWLGWRTWQRAQMRRQCRIPFSQPKT